MIIRLFVLYSLFCALGITRGTRVQTRSRDFESIDDRFSGRVKAVQPNWFSGLQRLFGFPEAEKLERILTSIALQ